MKVAKSHATRYLTCIVFNQIHLTSGFLLELRRRASHGFSGYHFRHGVGNVSRLATHQRRSAARCPGIFPLPQLYSRGARTYAANGHLPAVNVTIPYYRHFYRVALRLPGLRSPASLRQHLQLFLKPSGRAPLAAAFMRINFHFKRAYRKR